MYYSDGRAAEAQDIRKKLTSYGANFTIFQADNNSYGNSANTVYFKDPRALDAAFAVEDILRANSFMGRSDNFVFTIPMYESGDIFLFLY